MFDFLRSVPADGLKWVVWATALFVGLYGLRSLVRPSWKSDTRRVWQAVVLLASAAAIVCVGRIVGNTAEVLRHGWYGQATVYILFVGAIATIELIPGLSERWPERGRDWAFDGAALFSLLSVAGHLAATIATVKPASIVLVLRPLGGQSILLLFGSVATTINVVTFWLAAVAAVAYVVLWSAVWIRHTAAIPGLYMQNMTDEPQEDYRGTNRDPFEGIRNAQGLMAREDNAAFADRLRRLWYGNGGQ